MKTPYQRYTEHSFDDVCSGIREFHAKQQYALIAGLRNRAHLALSFDRKKMCNFIGKEIEFWPGLAGEVNLPCPRRDDAALTRSTSFLNFCDKLPLSFEVIKQFISDTLTWTEFDGDFHHRMYASGGALYPVEVFLCRLSNNIPDWNDVQPVYHLRANTRCLESIAIDDPGDLVGLRNCLSGYDPSIGNPHFALVYAIFIDKFIFKYKYRGYRNALMEVGSMYQICDMNSSKYGIRNRLWAGFHDGHVAKKLNIDITSILPCVVQFFGTRNVLPA